MWNDYFINASDDDLDKIIRNAKQERTRRGINYRLSVLLNEAKEMGDVFLVKESSNEIVDSKLVLRHISPYES